MNDRLWLENLDSRFQNEQHLWLIYKHLKDGMEIPIQP